MIDDPILRSVPRVATAADLLVTANPGYLMQIPAALLRHRRSIATTRTIEVSDASIRGVTLSAPPLEGD